MTKRMLAFENNVARSWSIVVAIAIFVLVLLPASSRAVRPHTAPKNCIVYQASAKKFVLVSPIKGHCPANALVDQATPTDAGWHAFCQDVGDACRSHCRADYETAKSNDARSQLFAFRQLCLKGCLDNETACVEGPRSTAP